MASTLIILTLSLAAMVGSYLVLSYSFAIRMTDEERGCENGEVRLQGGAGSSNGYVEFCLDRRWGGVCSDGWSINNTKVACQQRGFDPEGTSCVPLTILLA